MGCCQALHCNIAVKFPSCSNFVFKVFVVFFPLLSAIVYMTPIQSQTGIRLTWSYCCFSHMAADRVIRHGPVKVAVAVTSLHTVSVILVNLCSQPCSPSCDCRDFLYFYFETASIPEWIFQRQRQTDRNSEFKCIDVLNHPKYSFSFGKM